MWILLVVFKEEASNVSAYKTFYFKVIPCSTSLDVRLNA